MSRLLNIETHSGNPVQFGETQLIPFGQSIRLQIPGLTGEWIWNRPVSVLVSQAGGKEWVLPIKDITRQIIWSLMGAVLVFWLVYKRKRSL